MINSRVLGEWQEQILDRLRKGQETMAATFRAWARTAQSAKPQLPNVSVPTVRLPAVSTRMPSPKDVVAGTFDLAEQLLAAQRRLAEQAADAAAPWLGRPSAGGQHASPARPAPAARTSASGPGAPATASSSAEERAETTADPGAATGAASAARRAAKSGTGAKSRASKTRGTANTAAASDGTAEAKPGPGAEPTQPDTE
jgi:hypothetical protein